MNERERYEQLREILVLQISPELREIRRRQTVLQMSIWVFGMITILCGVTVILAVSGVLIGGG